MKSLQLRRKTALEAGSLFFLGKGFDMGILNRILTPIVEHSVTTMEENERRELFDRLIDRMVHEMDVDELIELLNRVLPDLFEKMTLQQKLKLVTSLLPKIMDNMDMNAVGELIDSIPAQPAVKQQNAFDAGELLS